MDISPLSRAAVIAEVGPLSKQRIGAKLDQRRADGHPFSSVQLNSFSVISYPQFYPSPNPDPALNPINYLRLDTYRLVNRSRAHPLEFRRSKEGGLGLIWQSFALSIYQSTHPLAAFVGKRDRVPQDMHINRPPCLPPTP